MPKKPSALALVFAAHMGFLDEAIREHLELKRRRGGDPGEIARAEQEALRPLDLGAGVPDWALGPANLEAQPPTVSEPEAGPYDRGLSNAEQETVEVDMAALIAQSEDAIVDVTRPASGEIAARRITSAPAGPGSAEDFDWEMPARHGADAEQQQAHPREGVASE